MLVTEIRAVKGEKIIEHYLNLVCVNHVQYLLLVSTRVERSAIEAPLLTWPNETCVGQYIVLSVKLCCKSHSKHVFVLILIKIKNIWMFGF